MGTVIPAAARTCTIRVATLLATAGTALTTQAVGFGDRAHLVTSLPPMEMVINAT